MVEPDLSVRDHPEVFAIGDTAHLVAPVRNIFGIKSRTPMLMPGVAQPAIQEGRYVADVIRRRVTGRAQPKPFWYWDKGELAIVGRAYAVADLRFAQFAGFPAWLVWAGVHIYFLIGFANRLFVSLQWGLAFLTKRRRVRILPEERASAKNLIDPAAMHERAASSYKRTRGCSRRGPVRWQHNSADRSTVGQPVRRYLCLPPRLRRRRQR